MKEHYINSDSSVSGFEVFYGKLPSSGSYSYSYLLVDAEVACFSESAAYGVSLFIQWSWTFFDVIVNFLIVPKIVRFVLQRTKQTTNIAVTT